LPAVPARPMKSALSRACARPALAPAFALAVLLAAAANTARADQPLWELGAGIGGLQLPHYRGAAEHSAWVVPIPYFVYRGKILRADRGGTRAVLFDSESIDIDLSLSASAPARSEDNNARRGMPDLQGQIEFGPKVNLHLARGADWRLDLRLPLRAVATLERRPHHIGTNFSPVLNLDARVQGFNLGLQAGPIWGDRKLHAYTYDVAAAYATAGRPAYQAGGGFAGWQATAALSRRIGRWWGAAYVRGDSVAGAVFEPSPLVQRSANVSAGFALSYVFATSSEMVPGNID